MNTFDLEKEIRSWRQQMRSAGLLGSKALEELEGHLRDDFSALINEGCIEGKAFELALSHLGAPKSVQAEFQKIKPTTILSVKIAAMTWMTVVILTMGGMGCVFITGEFNLVMCLHILCITSGYAAAILAGGCACCYAYWLRSNQLSITRLHSLMRAIQFFSPVALGLVMVGLATGLFASQQYFGHYWRWMPKEIGGLCVAIWLVALVAKQRKKQGNVGVSMLLCIGGGIVICLAWFGAAIINNYLRGYNRGPLSYLLLVILVSTYLYFGALLWLRQNDYIESKDVSS